MIVVIGNPSVRFEGTRALPGGIAAAVARVAAAAGADVQLVGKVGEDPAGDAVLLALAAEQVGHAAVLRDAGHRTPLVESEEPEPPVAAGDVDASNGSDTSDESERHERAREADASEPQPARPDALSLDAADLELALRYLPDYRVVVIAMGLDDAATETVVAAARWSGAELIAIVSPGERPLGLPDEATILEAPSTDPEGAFAAVVGAYAAALDHGAAPADAFAAASRGVGWAAVPD